MWYFTWILGLAFASAFAILNAMWYEMHAARTENLPDRSRET